MTSAASDLADLARFIRSDDSLHKLEEYREIERNALHAQHEAAIGGEKHRQEAAVLARAVADLDARIKAFEERMAREKAESVKREADLVAREMAARASEKTVREHAADLEVRAQRLRAEEAQVKHETQDLTRRLADFEKDVATHKARRSQLEKALRES